MKKTIVTMAALLLMAGGAMACIQQPEKKDAPNTEASVPAKTPASEEVKVDSLKGQPAADGAKVECTKPAEGCTPVKEVPASPAK